MGEVAGLEGFLHWLYFLPAEALAAHFGPRALAGALSGLAWTAGLLLVLYVPKFLQDVVDPTYRTQRREWRQAQRSRARM